MSDLRGRFMNFLFRTAICLFLLLLFLVIHRLTPDGFDAIKEKMFYSVDLGLLLKELKALGRCVLPV